MAVIAEERPAPRSDSRLSSLGNRVSLAMDLVLLSGLGLFASWTAFYLVALAGVLSSFTAFWAWLLTAPLLVFLLVQGLRPLLAAIRPRPPWVALVLCAGFAVAAALIVRPDLDDASYVVRSTWIAANGDVRVGDVIFSDGAWPGLPAQTPYLPSVEALFGWVARATGVSAGSVVYAVFPPVAAFGAIWALWMLFRSWGTRAANSCLTLACVFLLWGGAVHASWGNLHLARIWQGKVTLLALVIPLLYAVMAAYWTVERRAGRRAALAAVGLCSVAGVGLTPVAVFVLPGVVLVGAVPGLLQRRWREAVLLVAVGALPPLAAGGLVLLVGKTAAAVSEAGSVGEDPWLKVLGSSVPAAVVLVAVGVLVIGCLWPRTWAACGSVGRITALAGVGAGVLVAVPPLYELAAAVMGSDAVAWRLTWIVPVPALVGLLAGVPGRGSGWWRIPVAGGTAAALIWSGLPVWSSANSAWVAAPGTWKLGTDELATARWVADQDPDGRVLAPITVSVAAGIVTADVLPVGSKPAYLDAYMDQAGGQIEQRHLLQGLADGTSGPEDLVRASQALDDLQVTLACSFAENGDLHDVLVSSGFQEVFTSARFVCHSRAAAG